MKKQFGLQKQTASKILIQYFKLYSARAIHISLSLAPTAIQRGRVITNF
jgi:hypothetical protein